ncbi:MAG: insulinase family protein [Melioribacter sp.]|nr:insulinase family protein [Melioribacter sp.]
MRKFYLILLVLLINVTYPAQDVDRTKPPQLPPPKPLTLPKIEKFELSNGLKIFLMEKHNVPLIQLNLIIRTGSVYDPPGKEGLANLTFDMLDEGNAGKTSLEIADEIDYLGAKISTKAGLHFSGIYLHTPVTKFNDALKVMSKIVLKPDFPEVELKRKKKEYLTTISQWHDQPTTIANIAFNKFLFGDDHPYGKTLIGNETSIKNINREDLKKFYSSFFMPNNSFVIAVGDIKKGELKSKLEKIFGKWRKGEVKEIKISEPKQLQRRIVYLIDKPNSAQSVIYIGKIGVKRLIEDYNSIIVMNTILGGSFTSRLNSNLREQHGYTYGAGSRFIFRPSTGSFFAYSSVHTEVTDKALIEFFKELNAIREKITEEEIARAKNLVALSYPQNFQTVSDIAAQIQEMVEYNLPENYFNEYVKNILDVKEKDVNNAAKNYILPDKMIIVIVGDKSKIEESVRKLKLGEVINLNVEDVLGKIPIIDN